MINEQKRKEEKPTTTLEKRWLENFSGRGVRPQGFSFAIPSTFLAYMKICYRSLALCAHTLMHIINKLPHKQWSSQNCQPAGQSSRSHLHTCNSFNLQPAFTFATMYFIYCTGTLQAQWCTVCVCRITLFNESQTKTNEWTKKNNSTNNGSTNAFMTCCTRPVIRNKIQCFPSTNKQQQYFFHINILKKKKKKKH